MVIVAQPVGFLVMPKVCSSYEWFEAGCVESCFPDELNAGIYSTCPHALCVPCMDRDPSLYAVR